MEIFLNINYQTHANHLTIDTINQSIESISNPNWKKKYEITHCLSLYVKFFFLTLLIKLVWLLGKSPVVAYYLEPKLLDNKYYSLSKNLNKNLEQGFNLPTLKF